MPLPAGKKADCSRPAASPHLTRMPGHTPVLTAAQNLQPQFMPCASLCPPQTAAHLASNHSDFHKERLWHLEQHGHLPDKMSPREEGHQGFQGSSRAVPLPSRIHLNSLSDRTAAEHTPSSSFPLPQGFPSKLLTLAEVSLPGTVPPLFQVLLTLRSGGSKSHLPIPLRPTLLPWRLASPSFPSKPKRQSKKEVPQW